MRRRGERMALNAEINVVSLIDVMMLLMVIFMITAPLMTGGVDVSLPTADVAPLEPKTGVTVSVTKAGEIFVDDTRLTLDQFRGSFKALAGEKGGNGVYVRADQSVPYGIVVQVLAVIHESGITNVSLVAAPEGV